MAIASDKNVYSIRVLFQLLYYNFSKLLKFNINNMQMVRSKIRWTYINNRLADTRYTRNGISQTNESWTFFLVILHRQQPSCVSYYWNHLHLMRSSRLMSILLNLSESTTVKQNKIKTNLAGPKLQNGSQFRQDLANLPAGPAYLAYAHTLMHSLKY